MNIKIQVQLDFYLYGSNENKYPRDSDNWNEYERLWEEEANQWLIQNHAEQH